MPGGARRLRPEDDVAARREDCGVSGDNLGGWFLRQIEACIALRGTRRLGYSFERDCCHTIALVKSMGLGV